MFMNDSKHKIVYSAKLLSFFQQKKIIALILLFIFCTVNAFSKDVFILPQEKFELIQAGPQGKTVTATFSEKEVREETIASKVKGGDNKEIIKIELLSYVRSSRYIVLILDMEDFANAVYRNQKGDMILSCKVFKVEKDSYEVPAGSITSYKLQCEALPEIAFPGAAK